MKIENFPYAEAHFVDEPTDGLRIEADVKLNYGNVSEITNGQVTRTDGDVAAVLANFSANIGVTHRSYFGEQTFEEQMSVASHIETFCSAIREKDYTVVAQ